MYVLVPLPCFQFVLARSSAPAWLCCCSSLSSSLWVFACHLPPLLLFLGTSESFSDENPLRKGCVETPTLLVWTFRHPRTAWDSMCVQGGWHCPMRCGQTQQGCSDGWLKGCRDYWPVTVGKLATGAHKQKRVPMTAMRNAIEMGRVLPFSGQAGFFVWLESSVQLANFHPTIPTLKNFTSVVEDDCGQNPFWVSFPKLLWMMKRALCSWLSLVLLTVERCSPKGPAWARCALPTLTVS